MFVRSMDWHCIAQQALTETHCRP